MFRVRPSLLLAACLLVLAPLWSGCVAQDPTSQSVPSDATGPGPGADEGQIRGLVTDDSQSPIEGAQVALLDHDLAVVTDAAGEFRFDAVAPGHYRLVAQKIGFTSEARMVDVAAGQVANAVLLLRPIEVGRVPYTSLLIGQGYLACGAYLIVVTVSNLNVCPWDANHRPRYEFVAPAADFMGVAQEVTWEKNQVLSADYMNVYLWYHPVCDPTCSAEKSFTESEQPSPSRQYSALDKQKFEEDPIPLASMTFVGGDGNTPALVYQQKITHYITLCYVEHCDLDRYTAIPDQ